MATCCLSQTGAIFVLLAISKSCIRFRWSLYWFQPKSPRLSSGTLGFPCWGQVQSFLVKSCTCITYRIPHSIPRLHLVLFELCTWLIVFLLLVCIVWVEPGDEFANEEPVELAYEDQVNSTTLQARWSYPRNNFYLCLLDARSFAMPMLRCLPLYYHASQIAMSNL